MAGKPSITERIAAVAAASAGASMIPQPQRPWPKAQKGKYAPPETPPDIKEVIKDNKARLELARLVAEFGTLGLAKSQLVRQEKILSQRIKRMAAEYKVGKAVAGDWRINYFTVSRSKLETERLLALGVSPGVITAATTITEVPTLKISKIGQPEEDEE